MMMNLLSVTGAYLIKGLTPWVETHFDLIMEQWHRYQSELAKVPEENRDDTIVIETPEEYAVELYLATASVLPSDFQQNSA